MVRSRSIYGNLSEYTLSLIRLGLWTWIMDKLGNFGARS